MSEMVLKMRERARPIVAFGLSFGIILLLLLVGLAPAALAQEGSEGGSSTGNSVENTGANATVSTMLEMAANKQPQDKDVTQGQSLTNEDARVLGIFMSNFYTPFSTEVDKEVDENVKKQMDEILTKSLSFSEEMSVQIQDYIRSQVQGQSQDLRWGYSDKQNAESEDIWVPEEKDNAASYMNLHLYMSGQFKDHIKADAEWGKNPDTESETFNQILENERRYAYLYYDGADGPTPVFQLDLENENETPSTLAMRKVLDGIDPTNGWGSSVFDIKSGDYEITKPDDIHPDKDPIKGKSGTEAVQMTNLTAPMKVSPFGDIWINGTNSKVVAMPGAINPYVWEGEGGAKGETYNMINVISMAQSSAGDLNDGSGEAIEGRPDGVVDLTYKKNLTEDNIGKMRSYDRGIGVNSQFQQAYKAWPWIRGNAESDDFTGDDRQTWLKTSLNEHYYKNYPDNFGPPWYLYTKDGIDMREPNKSGVRSESEGEVGIPMGGLNQGFDHFWWPYIWDPTDQPGTKVPTFTNMKVMDNLGVFGWGTKEGDLDYNALQTASYLDDSGKGLDAVQSSMNDKGNDTGVVYDQMGEGDKMRVAKDFSDQYKQSIVSIYTTYVYAFYGTDEQKEELGLTGDAASDMPELTAGEIEMSEEEVQEATSDAIRDWTYYLLHPSEGAYYVSELVSKFVNSFTWKAHTEMVGTEGVGALPGSSKYISFSGYVTTPELSDIPLTDRILVLYKEYFLYIVLAFLVFLLIASIAGTITFFKAVTFTALFMAFALAAPTVINSAVSISNSVSGSVYGKKFMYWALISNQIYAQEIDEAAEGENYENYLQTVYQQNNATIANQGSSNVVVRWQAPKKMASLLSTTTTNEADDKDADENKINTMLGKAGEGTIDGQDFLDRNNATYMYRSYVDLGNFSRYIYRGLEDNQPIVDEIPESQTSSWDKGLQESYSTYVEDNDQYIFEGYGAPDVSGSSDARSNLSVKAPLSSKIVSDTFDQTDEIANGLTPEDYMGIPEGAFKFGIPMFAQKGDLVKGVKDISDQDGVPYDATKEGYKAEDLSGLAAYALMSESPYYGFSWNLYDRGMDPSNGSSENFKNLMLNNGGMFANNVKGGNGDTRDFMGMRDLFTYTIPYMRQGNEVVNAYDQRYGLKYHKGLPTAPGHENDEGIKGDPVQLQKYWSNVNVAQLYGIYAPWVDQMYDTAYAKGETISYQGKKAVIDDPLNPASYPEDRPMIFSESEMKDYGLGLDDLTQVENKILEVQRNTQERWYGLLNYYTFDDSVLNSAASMEATFEFNKEFSEPSIFGTSTNINLYPQSFELKNFTYDAYLRLMLAESVSGQGSPNGEDPTAAILQTGAGEVKGIGEGDDFYMKLQKETDMLFGVFLVLNDIVAIYLFPILKFIFLVGILLLTLLMVVASIRNLLGRETLWEKIKDMLQKVFLPLFLFTLLLIGHAWVVSLFMSNGATSVTGYDGPTLSLGSPNLTLVAMLFLNVVAVCGFGYLCFIIVMRSWETGKMITKDVNTQIQGAAGKAGGVLKGAAIGGAGFVLGKVGLGGLTDRFKGRGGGSGGGAPSGAPAGDGGVPVTSGGGGSTSNKAPSGRRSDRDKSVDEVPSDVPGTLSNRSRPDSNEGTGQTVGGGIPKQEGDKKTVINNYNTTNNVSSADEVPDPPRNNRNA